MARPADTALIQHQVQLQGGNGMRMESWYDAQTGRRRSVSTRDGKPAFESVMGPANGQMQDDMVMYGARVWYTHATGFPAPSSHSLPDYEARFRSMLSSGMYKSLGHETLDGRDVIHLRRAASMSTPLGTRAYTVDIWFDALTYLELHQRSFMEGASSGTQDVSYDYLPRTQSNLAKLDLVVPEGFRHERSGPGSTSSSTSSGNIFSFSSSQLLIGHS